MSSNSPEWLDEKFVLSYLLDREDSEGITIKSFSVSAAVPPGISHSSVLFRVRAEYQERSTRDVQTSSVIVKGPLEAASGDFYKTEPKFYNELLPAALEISSQEIRRFIPKTYFSSIPDVIVMEDLTREGYFMADKRALLDFDHCKLYAEASATFHAVSVAVHNKSPELVESLGHEKFYSKDMVGMKKLCDVGIRYMAEQMSNFDDYKHYADVLKFSAPTIYDNMVESLKPNATLNALCQGDPWTTNMMFKYDRCENLRNVMDIKLLDFQGLRYSSPISDLIFFIWTSSIHDVRESKLEDFYSFYCDTLNARLKEYNCLEILSFQQLKKHLRELSFMVIIVVTLAFPVILSPEHVDMASLLYKNCDDNEIWKVIHQCYNQDYRENHLPRILKQLQATGVFDYVEKYPMPSKAE